MESLSLLRLLVGIAFLGYASYSDVKTRRVDNRVWILFGLVGFIILALDLSNRSDIVWAHYLIFIPAGVMYFDVYLDRGPIFDEEGFHFEPLGLLFIAVVVIVLSFQGSILYEDPDQRALFLQLMTIPAMIILAHIFFQSGLLKGGADAKALMALAILVPFYPEFYGFPLVEVNSQIMTVLFPFALVILMNSAILVIFVPLVYLGINARRGNVEMPQCLLGYKADLNDFPKHVWLMEKAENDEVRVFLFPRRGGDIQKEIEALKRLGREKAWVTPQLPFMVPMLLGLIASFFIGNFVLAVIYLVL
jgi:preflagellin peptidase FlaK